jgi:hypothetical protein
MHPLFGRREAIGSLLSSFLVVALVREARGSPAPGDARVRSWIETQQQIAEALAAGRMRSLDWALEVERLAGEVDVEELMAAVRRSRVTEGRRGSHNDPEKRFVRFLGEDGEPRRLAYGAALFDFAPENVITPHGHLHMVSAHMVVAGRFRVRNFDRIGDEDGAMLIRPTRDFIAGPGRISTMCPERDNIHWFVPVGGPATTFDLVIDGLDPGAPDFLIQAVDPLAAEARPDGALRAPVIGFEESARRYTAAV